MIADLACSRNYKNLRLSNFDRHTELIQDGAQPQTSEVLQLYDLMTNEMKHKC